VTEDPFIICRALYATGNLLAARRRWAEAESRHREGLTIARDCDDFSSIVMAVLGLSDVLHRTGRPLETKGLYLDTLRLASDAGTRSFYDCLLGGLCWVAIAEGRPVRAARLSGASMASAVSAGGCPAELPSRLGLEDNNGRTLWSLGHAMSTQEAVVYALSDA
jgi:hypothetical protein